MLRMGLGQESTTLCLPKMDGTPSLVARVFSNFVNALKEGLD